MAITEGAAVGAAGATGRARGTLAALGLACLPALLDPGAIGRAAAWSPSGDPPVLFATAGQTGLALLWFPVVAASAVALFLAPGLLLAERSRHDGSVDAFLTRAFGAALSWNLLLVGVAGVAGWTASGRAWSLVAAATSGSLVALRRWRPPSREAPPGVVPALAASLGVVALLAALLAPKFLWESFNGDGAGVYETSRLLLRSAVPFFPSGIEGLGQFPGITSFLFAFPGAWFLRLFGPCEAAVRVPVLLHLVGLHAAVLAATRVRGAIRWPRPERAERLLLWAFCAVYLVALAYSATYNPYAADIAQPAMPDTLLAALFVGVVWAWWSRAWGWTALFAALCYVALPNGGLLIAGLLVARAIVERPRPWGDIARLGAVLAACVVVAALAPAVLRGAGLPTPGGEYDVGRLATRLLRLQGTAVERILLAALPAGLAPFAVLFARKPHWPMGRALALLTVGYFLLFYVQASVTLHHFVPAMVLPWVVFFGPWGRSPAPPSRRRVVLAAVAALVALALVLPTSMRPFTEPGRIGRSIVYDSVDYARGGWADLARLDVLQTLFPKPWDGRVPQRALGVARNVWLYYVHRPAAEKGPPVYRIQDADDPAPPGAVHAGRLRGVSLYLLDAERAAADVAIRPPTPAGAPALALPREVLYRTFAGDDGPPVLDLRDLWRRRAERDAAPDR